MRKGEGRYGATRGTSTPASCSNTRIMLVKSASGPHTARVIARTWRGAREAINTSGPAKTKA